jgi:Ca2+-binding EF-hand superfamily protein
MLSLKPHTIDHLKEEFIYNQNRITLEKFIFLMKESISYDKNREYEILYELIKLFEEIDIDSNGFIDWD